MSKKLGFALSGLMLAMVAGTASADMDGGQINISGLLAITPVKQKLMAASKMAWFFCKLQRLLKLPLVYLKLLSVPKRNRLALL